MATTVLSGTSGALYYKPAGTTDAFAETDVNVGTDTITVKTYLNFKVGDPVQFSVVNSTTGVAGTGTLPGGLSTATTFYVSSYTAATGALQVSATDGGSAVTLADDGTAVSPNAFQVAYDSYTVIGQVRDWSFGQYVPFRTYISGFGDGTGSATIYMTDNELSLGNRIVDDVLQRNQTGAGFKLYTNEVFSGGTVSDTLSSSIEFDAVLTSASMNVNPDDAQSVAVNFRPSSTPVFDFSATS